LVVAAQCDEAETTSGSLLPPGKTPTHLPPPRVAVAPRLRPLPGKAASRQFSSTFPSLALPSLAWVGARNALVGSSLSESRRSPRFSQYVRLRGGGLISHSTRSLGNLAPPSAPTPGH
ncbi:unnamed protein product, partial [Chrysoparadoxa australica]